MKNRVKKTETLVENFSTSEAGRRSKISQIQSMLSEGYSYREIIKRLGVSPKTISRFRTGDPDVLCRAAIRNSQFDPYQETIDQCLNDGLTKAQTVQHLKEAGCTGSDSALYEYLNKIERFSEQRFSRSSKGKKAIKLNAVSARTEGKDYIKRTGLINYLWKNDGLIDDSQKKALFSKHPILFEIQSCIQEFKYIFQTGNMPMLHLFIKKYTHSSVKEFCSFARGLLKDIDAVENAVASPLSNGFVEGTNNKLKMVKRMMYGRCGIRLLRAKLMLDPKRYGNLALE